MNFIWTTKYLKKLNISYVNDTSKNSYCDSCKRAKATKRYNQTPQEHFLELFQEIHTNMIGSIKPLGFSGEQYFSTFTKGHSRFTYIYTATHKHDWFDHLQTFYSLAQNVTQKSKQVSMIRTDFSIELWSTASDK